MSSRAQGLWLAKAIALCDVEERDLIADALALGARLGGTVTLRDLQEMDVDDYLWTMRRYALMLKESGHGR